MKSELYLKPICDYDIMVEFYRMVELEYNNSLDKNYKTLDEVRAEILKLESIINEAQNKIDKLATLMLG